MDFEKYSQEFVRYLEKSGPEQWHQSVRDYNQLLGLEPLKWIICNPLCDKGTALLIYWYIILMTGDKRDNDTEKLISFNDEWINLALEIEEKFGNDFYTKEEFAYDPSNDSGTDFTKGHHNGFIPEVMFAATHGKSVEEIDLVEGMPEEVNDIVSSQSKHEESSVINNENRQTIPSLPPTKFWVFRTMLGSYGQAYVQAELKTPNYFADGIHWYGEGDDRVGIKTDRESESYGVNLKLTYSVNPKHNHPDSYSENHGLDLYSDRLIDLLHEVGVDFESFPVKMIDRQGNELPELKYSVFHLLNANEYGLIDLDASGWIEDEEYGERGVNGIVLKEGYIVKNKMFHPAPLFCNMMTDDLRKLINERGITGFKFLHPLRYKSGKFGFSPNYDD